MKLLVDKNKEDPDKIKITLFHIPLNNKYMSDWNADQFSKVTHKKNHFIILFKETKKLFYDV